MPTIAMITPRAGLDLGGEVEVLVGEAAGVVGRERDPHLAVADVEVRVVVGGLGPLGDAGDEGDRVGERRELEGLHDLVARHGPSPGGSEAFGDAVGGKGRHGPIVDLGGARLRVGRAMAPGEGLEPSTSWLTVKRSAN